MAKVKQSLTNNSHESLHKRTSQGGRRAKTSTMNKSYKRCHKKYRGQGK
jgi:hypothetical protein